MLARRFWGLGSMLLVVLLPAASARAAVPTWEELEQPFSARIKELASHPEADQAQGTSRDPRCANGIACSGDLRLSGEAGTGGDRLVFGAMTGLSLSGRYRLLQLGLDYHRVADSGSVSDIYTAHAGLAWQSSYGLRLEAAALGGWALSTTRDADSWSGVGRGLLGLRGAISYEFAASSPNHLLVGLALSGGTSLPSESQPSDVGPWGGANLTLGYALDI